ncbi:class I fructose-bisphosphate aldolase [Sphingomonas sp. CARO-RG-8B-R24-01]|uniref:class I fructose-bisphosphate aldolase n=1 Tax=Sphingomonas sp. CARO-RG-8B-R24-01 TaxID=2914831 RepID=UPI001F569A49|nr:class I fructose-bisphosphate aldolase [Sphingomonas sp. CARO-RG-8B-R24-01]
MSRTEQVLQTFRQSRRGLLAFDEQLVTLRRPGSLPSIITSAELRRTFHETCIAATGLSPWIGGICVFEETLRQHTASGNTLPALITERHMTVGVRMDTGSVPFAAGYLVTDGIDDLAIRLNRTAAYGAQFATWHMALRSNAQISGCEPAFAEDCDRAATFVTAAQQADLLPLLAVDAGPHGEASARAADCHQHFFRRLISVLKRRFARLPPIAIQVRLRPAVGGNGGARRVALLQTIRAELPESIAILFLGVDDADQFVQAMSAFGEAADLPWPVRYALGPSTQTRLLASWQDTSADQKTLERLLLEQVRASSGALTKS